jgi:ABC-type glycerol-3-phosphate transport system substrate-binding protein
MNQQLERFSQRHPGVSVEHQLVGGGERLEKIMANMAGGTAPDVPMVGRQEIPMFVERLDGLSPLDALMSRDGIGRGLFYPAEIDACAYAGRTWALPMPAVGTYGNVHYNREWLTREGLDPDRRPPRTWDELQEVAQRLTRIEGGRLVKLGFPMAITGLQFWHWLGLDGGRLWSDDGRRLLLERAEETLQWMVDFRDKVNGGRAALQGFPPGGGNAFYKGDQAQVLSGVWNWYFLRTEAPDLQAGIYLRPSRRGDQPRYLALENWGYAVARESRHQEAAWRLAAYLSVEPEGGGWFLQQQGQPSAVKAINQAPEMRKDNPYWDVYLKSLEYSVVPGSYLPVHAEVVQVINEQVTRLDREEATPRETAAAIRQQGQRLIDDFWSARRR